MGETLKGVVRMFKNMDYETIQVYKYLCFVLIMVSLFGVYWFLEMKTLAIALILVILVFLTIFLILERQKAPNEATGISLPKDEPPKSPFEFDMGMGNSEEYNKRLEKAMRV